MQGLGSDLIEVVRIEKSIEKYGVHFLNKIFTEKEQTYCLGFTHSAPHFAGRFAAKEAVAKALGTGFGEKLKFSDVQILNDSQGKPEVFLSVEAKKLFPNLKILLTITHTKEYALAVAISQREGD